MGAIWAQPLFMHCLLHTGVVCIQQGQYMSGGVLTPDAPDEGIELSGEQRHLNDFKRSQQDGRGSQKNTGGL